MHVVFLLGAGVSFDLLPLSRSLDETVLTARAPDGRVVSRDSDSTYRLARPYDVYDAGRPYVERVTAFLNWLTIRFPDDQRNYEALYFACRQIHDEIMGELENPLLEPFLVQCEEQAPGLIRERDRPPRYYLNDLVVEAMNYIARSSGRR